MWEYLVKKITPRQASRESSDIHPLKAPRRNRKTEAVDGEPGEAESRRRIKKWKGRTLSCPVCGTDMERRWIGKVEVDQCPECLGIFLDRGELKAISGMDRSTYQHGPAAAHETLIYTPHGLSDHLKRES